MLQMCCGHHKSSETGHGSTIVTRCISTANKQYFSPNPPKHPLNLLKLELSHLSWCLSLSWIFLKSSFLPHLLPGLHFHHHSIMAAWHLSSGPWLGGEVQHSYSCQVRQGSHLVNELLSTDITWAASPNCKTAALEHVR